jgi:hypothetical protein
MSGRQCLLAGWYFQPGTWPGIFSGVQIAGKDMNETKVEQFEKGLDRIEEAVYELTTQTGKLCGAAKTTETMVKWIILPLITILGALVGVDVIGG